MSCKPNDYNGNELYTWCTGCGNYGIAHAEKIALANLKIEPSQALVCFDIGCNGNGADKLSSYTFHGLHGRVLPFAAGAAIANTNLTVIAHGGDGATLSEGINHLIHSVRNNYNITFILHNNHNYALTKGQPSCTTPADSAMDMYPQGTGLEPINVCELVLNLGGSFVARGFSNDLHQLASLIEQGVNHKGFSFIEVLQDCPTYNKDTNNAWYWERITQVQPAKTQALAIKLAQDMPNKINTGVLFKNSSAVEFMQNLPSRVGKTSQLIQEVQNYSINQLTGAYVN